jgi:hypothetical protein
MAQITRTFLIFLVSIAVSTWASARDDGAPLWAELSISQRTALTPIAYDWDQLPAQQRQKLLKVVQEFAKLTPAQQQIFYSRLQPWTRMTQAQRDAARDNFTKLQALPKPEQEQIKRLWTQTVGAEAAQNPGR